MRISRQLRSVCSPKWRFVLLLASGLLISYADRSNLAIAILPMSKQFDWSLKDRGMILSSFFYGYLLTQILGGVLADRFGGKNVLLLGSLVWSLLTSLTPKMAIYGIYSMVTCRIFLGLGEGVAFPAAHSLVAKWIPKKERSTAIAIITSFAYSGSPLAALASAPIAASGDSWPWIFYLFGFIGLTWSFFWLILASDTPPYQNITIESYQEITPEDSSAVPELSSQNATGNLIFTTFKQVPWRKIFTSKEVWAIFINQFCSAWGFYIIINWLPTYFQLNFGIDLNNLGILSAIPYTAQGISGLLSGFLADYFISKEWSVLIVRRYLQIVGMVGPGIFLFATAYISQDAVTASFFLTITMFLQGFTLGALSVSQHDIAPAHAGVIFGLGNLFGTIPGAIGVWLTGAMLDSGLGWSSIFGLASILRLIGAVAWYFMAGGDRIVIH